MTTSNEFFRTRMGHVFYQVTMPKIADELERLNATLTALVGELRAFNERANQAPATLATPSSRR